MIGFREAQQLLVGHAASFGHQELGLEDAPGRVLAAGLFADRDYPPFDRSCMDGYALRYDDFQQGLRQFKVVETIFAGMVAANALQTGQCCKIMTGAPLPEGADMVVRKEETQEAAGDMEMLSGTVKRYQHVSRRGDDLRAGEQVVQKNLLCNAQMMGLLATLGKTRVLVERLPRVTLLTTGDEVVDAGDPVGPVQIRNSNRWIVHACLKNMGVGLSHYAHLPDDKRILKGAVDQALRSTDLLILSGGVSVGDADHVPGVLDELGVEKFFHKIAIKPGKPVWCGRWTEKTMVFALPGNPFSCLVGFTLLIAPWLNACFGLEQPASLGLPLDVSRSKKTPLDEFFPVRMAGSPAVLSPVAFNGSGDIRLAFAADGLALHPADAGDLQTGAKTDYYPFCRF